MLKVIAVVIADVDRWIDSLWHKSESAKERVSQIQEAARVTGAKVTVFMVELQIEDVSACDAVKTDEDCGGLTQ